MPGYMQNPYDPKTGRGVWTGAFEALESALADSATNVNMLADDGECLTIH